MGYSPWDHKSVGHDLAAKTTAKIIQWNALPGSLSGKESAYNSGDLGSIPGSERSPGEGNDNPLQHSCLENPRDRGAWCAAVYGVT